MESILWVYCRWSIFFSLDDKFDELIKISEDATSLVAK